MPVYTLSIHRGYIRINDEEKILKFSYLQLLDFYKIVMFRLIFSEVVPGYRSESGEMEK